MINSIIYLDNNKLSCHLVGVRGCKSIEEIQNTDNSIEYKAIYNDGESYNITTTIIASDISLV